MEVLRRHPVKSMLGEAVDMAHVGGRGLGGDRVMAVLDTATGKVASAKHPRLWRALLTVAARTGPDGITLRLPDGTEQAVGAAAADRALCTLLGREVALISDPPEDAELDRATPEEVVDRGVDAEVTYRTGKLAAASPPGTFFDFAPLHLITTATLDRIAALSPSGRADAVRYRPNLVVRTPAVRTGGTGLPGSGFTENGWSGRRLAIGPSVRLEVQVTTPRCAVPTLAHGELPGDTAALQVLARHNRVPVLTLGELPCAGVYAQVLSGGVVRTGDPVRLLDG
ncbi:MOSC domain-containing protein [Peterkaempfera sp. SMS 1(5)a]|uniref:MOSC domain-containing protein n=1 Tax=Peterkaempfera podocarpi TaxID=3232308 RepID=UPI00366E2C72